MTGKRSASSGAKRILKHDGDPPLRGGYRVIKREVAAGNSAVLGRKANPDHDARSWSDGWKNLGVHDKRAWVDGKPSKSFRWGLFGAGAHHGRSCGEYLHAPVLGRGNDGRWYRVRSRIQPGDRVVLGNNFYAVNFVRLEKIKGLWHWVYKLESAQLLAQNEHKSIESGVE